MIVEELQPQDHPSWDAFVRSHSEASHYHLSGWREVIARAFGHQSLYRIARDGGEIVGILPIIRFANPLFGRYLVSMPYLNRGGILAKTPEAANALLADGIELVKQTNSKFLELRHVVPCRDDLPRRTEKVSMSLDVRPGVDALWDSIGPKVRNLVRKAEKGGLTVREGDRPEDLDTFFELFAENMRDLGTPVYTPRFFREVHRVFHDSIRLSVVEKEGVPAAVGFCLTWNGFTEIHWAASRRSMLSLSPNMVLYWDAISWAAKSGLHTFCFGRSTVDSGPYRFKKQWGAVGTPLAWEFVLAPGAEMPRLNPDNPKFRAAVAVWKKMPIGLTKVLGPPIVRHIP